jgi:hypothetical protein
MKKLAIIALLCGAAAVSAADETTRDTRVAPQKPELVETAKEAKAKRKASSTKVITNKDVKKSKGKLVVLDKPATDATVTEKAKTSSLVAQDDRYRARAVLSEKVTTQEKKVLSLEKDIEAIEQRYYEENDPNYRDSVIQQRFTQAKRQLEEARTELADARDALKKLEDPQP